MKSYLLAILFALILSFVLGTGWYSIFGYDPYVTMPENIVAIYTTPSFWYGVLIWTALYAAFITVPITFFKNRAIGS